jgi:hypothetical protein
VLSENGEESPQHLSVTSIDGREFSHSPQIDDFIFSSAISSIARENSCTVVAFAKSDIWNLLERESKMGDKNLIDLKDFSDYLEKAHQQKKSDQ